MGLQRQDRQGSQVAGNIALRKTLALPGFSVYKENSLQFFSLRVIPAMLSGIAPDGLTIVVCGETIDDAVTVGLRQLNLPRSHVTVEVIERGRKGGFFRRRADAVVRLAPTGDIDGAVAIVNGQVQVRAPLGPGRPGHIAPGNGIAVTVDGTPVTAPTAVLPNQAIALAITAELNEQDRYTIEVGPDKMSATLRVNALGSYRIADTPMTADLTPRLSLTLGTTLTEAEVLAALEQRGVRYGIDRQSIADAIGRADGLPTVIARGIPMTPGRDGYLRWLITAVQAEAGTDERVNHLERDTPLTVEADTELAKVEPLVPGEPGTDIFGEEVSVPPPDEFRAVAGPGARITDDGTVVSTQAGRPVEAKRARYSVVRVLSVYEHRGDVDRLSGNLHVKGDLIITGSVVHSMEVTAGGSITILGDVSQASVKACGSITVHGNCIASTLVSGDTRAFFKSVEPKLEELDNMLSAILIVVGEVMKAPGFKTEELERQGLGPLLQVLVERRFPNIYAVSRAVDDMVNELDDPHDDLIRLISQVMRSKLLGGRLFEVRTLSELADAKYLLSRIRETMAVDAEIIGHISVAYCEESTLRSQGSIRVNGRGSYRSRLVARARIEVKEAVVGGTLRTDEAIEVSRVGNDLGVVTHLEVSASGRIQARSGFPNTHLKVGRFQYILNEQTSFRAKLNEKGDLRVTR